MRFNSAFKGLNQYAFDTAVVYVFTQRIIFAVIRKNRLLWYQVACFIYEYKLKMLFTAISNPITKQCTAFIPY